MRHSIPLLVILLVASILLVQFTQADVPPTLSIPTVPSLTAPTSPSWTDLLVNPGFEEGFSYRHDPYTGIWAGELEVADGWDLWYDNLQECPPYDPECANPNSYNRRPEYKRESGTARVRSGQYAQKFFTTYGTHTAGLYQSVEVPPNSWVRFSIWVWTWSSNKDIPEHSFLPGPYGVSIGIDPTGGEAWDSPEIQWTAPITRPDQWIYLQTDAHTASGQISVWTQGKQRWPVKHNDSYWDDAELVVLDVPPEPTATISPSPTPYPTPEPTPDGHEPDPCWKWRTAWLDAFDDQQLDGWGRDPAEGSVDATGGALKLANGPSPSGSFPLAWLERPWPQGSDLRLSFRFAFDAVTGYGTTIGIGSQSYDGQRHLGGWLAPEGIEDILRVYQHTGEFGVDLLGQTLWTGTPRDTTWHTLQLELREETYILSVDETEVGRGVSYWRPFSLYLGNPIIIWDLGMWTEVAIDDLRLEVCDEALALPLVMRNHIEPRPTIPAEPTMTTSPLPPQANAGQPSPTVSPPAPRMTPPGAGAPRPSHRGLGPGSR